MEPSHGHAGSCEDSAHVQRCVRTSEENEKGGRARGEGEVKKKKRSQRGRKSRWQLSFKAFCVYDREEKRDGVCVCVCTTSAVSITWVEPRSVPSESHLNKLVVHTFPA